MTLLCASLAAVGLAAIVRALIPQWMLLHKPFSCDLCCGFWGSVGYLIALVGCSRVHALDAALLLPPATGAAFLLLLAGRFAHAIIADTGKSAASVLDPPA